MADLIDRDKLLCAYCTDCNSGEKKPCPIPGRCHEFNLIKNAPAVNCWIPCSERLPEAGVPVLTFDGEYMRVERHIGCIDDDGEKMKGEWWIDGTEGDNYNCVGLRDGTATHWMPLPEPPESEVQ